MPQIPGEVVLDVLIRVDQSQRLVSLHILQVKRLVNELFQSHTFLCWFFVDFCLKNNVDKSVDRVKRKLFELLGFQRFKQVLEHALVRVNYFIL